MILAEFSSLSIQAMAAASGQKVATIREGLRSCKDSVSNKLANKINKLNLAFAVTRHLTKEYCADVVGQLKDELRLQRDGLQVDGGFNGVRNATEAAGASQNVESQLSVYQALVESQNDTIDQLTKKLNAKVQALEYHLEQYPLADLLDSAKTLGFNGKFDSLRDQRDEIAEYDIKGVMDKFSGRKCEHSAEIQGGGENNDALQDQDSVGKKDRQLTLKETFERQRQKDFDGKLDIILAMVTEMSEAVRPCSFRS